MIRNSVVIVRKFFKRAAGFRKLGEKSTQRTVRTNVMGLSRESLRLQNEESGYVCN